MGVVALISRDRGAHGKGMARPDHNRFIRIFLLSLILLFSIVVDPARIHFISCPFKEITGLSCLTCGLSRSFYAASHVRMGDAFRYHLMGPILLGMILLAWVKFMIEWVARKKLQSPIKPAIGKMALVLLCGMWIGFWIVRFLNEWPHR